MMHPCLVGQAPAGRAYGLLGGIPIALRTKARAAWGGDSTTAKHGVRSVDPEQRGHRHPGKEAEMLKALRKLARDKAGQDLAEYGIALAVIAVGAAAAAVAIAGNVQTLWTTASAIIASAVGN